MTDDDRQDGDDAESLSIFNDLLFNSLGMFVFLLMVVMTMIGLPDVSREDREQLAKDLDAARKQHAQTSHELDTERRRTEQAAAEQAARVAALREQLQQLAGQLAEAKEALTAATSAQNTMAGLADQRRQRIEELQQQVNVLEERSQQTARELQQAQTALAQARDEATQARAALNAAQRQTTQAQAALDHAWRQAHPAATLATQPIDLVIAIDGTQSMDPVLKRLQDALQNAARVGSTLSPRFRLGIVVYREAKNTNIFPLTEIGPPIGGQPSAGMRAYHTFAETRDVELFIVRDSKGEQGGTYTGEKRMVTKLDSFMANADIEHGVREALAMLNQDRSPQTRKVLMVIGDVGPWEGGVAPHLIERVDVESATRIKSMLEAFTKGHRQARVVSMFSGRDIPNLENEKQTIQFFRDMAAAAGDPDRYSDQIGLLGASVVDAIIAPPAP